MILRHLYIREGDSLPEDQISWIFHVASRDDGTGLDIWWWVEE